MTLTSRNVQGGYNVKDDTSDSDIRDNLDQGEPILVDSDNDDTEVNGKDNDFLIQGQMFLTENVTRWRRLVANQILVQRSRETSEVASRLQNPGRNDAITTCPHTAHALRKGGNQHAQYIHCMRCIQRIQLIRTPKVSNDGRRTTGTSRPQ